MKNLILKIRPFLDTFRLKWYNVSAEIQKPLYGLVLWQIGAIIAALLVTGCGTTKLVPVEAETKEKIEIRDSIVYRDTFIYIPQERIVEVVPQLDTLKMEIEQAKTTAYLDTDLMLLRGTLESKKATQKEYIERIEYRERIDTVYVSLPQPYPVEKAVTPKWAWYSLIANIITMLLVAFKIYLKIKP